jgi:penicillin V acylase-like amidase (Ntn superfamily)
MDVNAGSVQHFSHDLNLSSTNGCKCRIRPTLYLYKLNYTSKNVLTIQNFQILNFQTIPNSLKWTAKQSLNQGCTQENVRIYGRAIYFVSYLDNVVIFLHIIDLELKADSVMCKNINMVHG